MSVDCDPNALMQAAKCFSCIPKGSQEEVMVYLLAQIAGGSTDPATLMQEAKCFKCIPKGELEEVMAYLLCQISNSALCPQDCLLRLTPPMTNGLSAIGLFVVNSNPSFAGHTDLLYLGTALGDQIRINSSSLVSMRFPNLVTINGTSTAPIQLAGNGSLVTIELPVFLPTKSKTYTFGNSPLSAATVNGFLARAVANPAFTAGTITLNGTGVSPPTGQGIIDKATLQGRGVTVNTN